MAKLILKEFRCVEDTDESFGESPYFIVFAGDLTTGKTEVKLIRQGNWHNEVDKGELWVVNAPAVSGFSFTPNPTLVLVALVEEDDNLDVNNVEVNGLLKLMLSNQFKSFKDSGSTTVTSAIANSLKSTFTTTLSLFLSNDDNMGVKRLTVNGQTGPQPLLNYFADTGHYRVRFVVE
jgi:hypothetical protein